MPTVDLASLISDVENTQKAYQSATTQVQADQANIDSIQAKLDAAVATKTTDIAVAVAAAKPFNDALDAAIAGFQAAKITIP